MLPIVRLLLKVFQPKVRTVGVKIHITPMLAQQFAAETGGSVSSVS